jgi:hypothetical protein
VLDDWDEILPSFIKVMPHDLKRVLRERQEAENKQVPPPPAHVGAGFEPARTEVAS